MASSLVVTVKCDQTQAYIQQLLQLPTNSGREAALALSLYFKALASMNERGIISVQTNADAPVAASATATLVSCATDTITVGTTTFTGTGTPTTSLHFETDGTNDADAAALCAAINAHTTANKLVKAEVSSNVVTVTALQQGVVGNSIVFSETGSTITCTGSGFLASGAGGAGDVGKVYTLGI